MSKLSFGRPDLVQFEPNRSKRGDIKRGSARERGYDADWDKLSRSHRRIEPLCRECGFLGRVTVCELVDHIVPVVDAPERRLDRSNLQSLCQHHHDMTKRALEAAARSIGDIELLTAWCRDPATRPARYAYHPKPSPRA